MLRAGIPLSQAFRLAFAFLAVPGAMAAGLSDGLSWWSLVLSLAIAFVVAVPVNRWLIGRGRGRGSARDSRALT